jgi:RNA polymerase sigma-70 factor (ECF subfamily)
MRISVALPLNHEHDDQDGAATDEAAMIEHACNDPAAFEPIYHRYRERIYWYIRARTLHEEDAVDLAQQVFVHALGALRQYRRRQGTVAAWLFGIAHHAAIDYHRRTRPTIAWQNVPPALHPHDGHDLEADAERNESLARLRQVLAALPDDKRELLALRYAGGLAIVEVAAVIGKSAEATRKQLTRTLQHLEECYHDEKDTFRPGAPGR